MKIGFICSNYFPLVGGVEVHARQISLELSKRHQVVVGAMRFETSQLPQRLKALQNHLLVPKANHRSDGNVSIFSLSPSYWDRVALLPLALRVVPRLQRWFHHEINRFTHPFYARVIVPKIKKALWDCDIIHGLVHGDIGWAAQKAARALGVPFVCTPFVHPGQWGDGPNDIAFYQRSDAVIGLVETDRAHLQKIGVPANKLHVIGVSPDLPALPQNYDASHFRKKHGIATEAKIVLYVGRMMKEKGSTAMLESTSHIWKQYPDTQFLFVGPASESEIRLFKNLDTRVRYLGRLSQEEKADAMAACDVFCMPSISEILPTVYLEAWKLGKPVVGGCAPGLRELVEGNHAGFCSSQNPEELAKPLIRLLGNAQLRQNMGCNGQALVEKHYSVSSITNQLESLYSQLLS